MSLIRRLSRRFSSRPTRRRQEYSDGKSRDKDSIACKVNLLDGGVLSFNVEKRSIGDELIQLVNKNLDLIEKEYFGLQYTDSQQVLHWLDPSKRIRKQLKGNQPYQFYFRVKFYAPDPHTLEEELTRYHFFLQIKQDILANRLKVPLKKLVEIAAYSLQSELGDFDPEFHEPDYIKDYKFISEQTDQLEKEIHRKHRQFAGLNPADCEVNSLKILKTIDSYGMHKYEVKGKSNQEKFQIGLSYKGIIVMEEGNSQAVTIHSWPRITSLSFRRNKVHLVVESPELPSKKESFTFHLSSAKASKQLWKAAIENHAFFRLLKTGGRPSTSASTFFRRGSKFRFSGRTQHQVNAETKKSARKQMKIERTKSERYSKRSTVGYIRVGSKVWAKALNGDYYKGIVTGLGEKVHIKFDNEETVAHERDAKDCVVFDMNPNPEDIEINMRVIAHWSSIVAYLSGTVIKIEGQKYYVHYDDGDKGWNNIRQIRILKPPTYFGPGAKLRNKVKKAESVKETSMMSRPITVEKPLKAKDRQRLESNGKNVSSQANPNGENHDNEYNERKISTNEAPNGHGARHHTASTADRRYALNKLLHSSDVGTDVDTGDVIVHDDQSNKNNHAAAPTSMRNISSRSEERNPSLQNDSLRQGKTQMTEL